MKINTKLTLKFYWQQVRKHYISGLIVLFGVVGGSAAGAVTPLYYKKLFDLLAQTQSRNILVVQLIQILLIIAAVEIIGWVFWRLAVFFIAYFQSFIMADLSDVCFKYLHKHSFAYFNNNFVGSLVKKVNRFTRAFEDITDRFYFSILQLITSIVIILFVLTKRNLALGLGIVAWIIVFFIANLIFTKFKLRYDLARSEADSKATGILADTITNNVNVKLFGGYNREVKNFGKAISEVKRFRLLTWNLGGAYEAVQSLLTIILELGIFYIAIGLWKDGILTIGDFVLIQSYVLIVIMRSWDFGRVIQHIYEDLAEAEEMTIVLSEPHEITDIKNAASLKVPTGQIEFNDVSFYYHETRSILEKFDLTIAPKEKVALVGPSGAGKTTIIKLLLRMYDIFDGKILIDGQDISRVTQESLWRNVSMVPQDPILFHRSLLENIRYGKSDATEAEVIRAAKLAHCHEFIKDLPEGYDTFVGERGVKLSGGERQRVAIARAILHNSPILILDEATSSLDSQSEKLIQDALNILIKGKTVLVVAHRLSTIMKMDRIIVVKDGKIAEQGTHHELLEKSNGLYHKLWEVQAGGFIA
ncbi:MAG: Xenobiotic-transporting ATPase [Candidatus Magasanikbacteria bacterium GW2011_GWA2_40_10]|uniref:Xenobiotic-transporting ATPase n=1 Tax=Candidatus Magasanikbacteria bacterium GW2011_GWA2_40_10 TaxID=1619037 RepID=A0A0G0Q320_9BACT|nr:MAG: Xenobiotic-transporting ATPase [Candidatus Magasanikbacteria bacterium GW2011_GWA2_40_10]